jgi:hypothetical protein
MPAAFRSESRDLWVPYDINHPPVDAPIAPRMLTPIARLAVGVCTTRRGRR